jgi:predicted protein tyrosine phosphatase
VELAMQTSFGGGISRCNGQGRFSRRRSDSDLGDERNKFLPKSRHISPPPPPIVDPLTGTVIWVRGQAPAAIRRAHTAQALFMIAVCPLQHLDATVTRHRPSHVLTLLSPGQEDGTRRSPSFEQHLQLAFHDIGGPRDGLIAPDGAAVGAILGFAHGWSGERPMLVHCWAGISRSSAAAYIVACARNPDREHDIAHELRRRAPFATPNPLMVALADGALRRSNRMVEAIARIGRGAEAFQGLPYELPISFPSSTMRISTPPS